MLDGASRYLVAWSLRQSVTEAEVEILLQRAKEKLPEARPRIISDNGPRNKQTKRHIGPIDPHALKIPARRAESLFGEIRPHLYVEPKHPYGRGSASLSKHAAFQSEPGPEGTPLGSGCRD